MRKARVYLSLSALVRQARYLNWLGSVTGGLGRDDNLGEQLPDNQIDNQIHDDITTYERIFD